MICLYGGLLERLTEKMKISISFLRTRTLLLDTMGIRSFMLISLKKKLLSGATAVVLCLHKQTKKLINYHICKSTWLTYLLFCLILLKARVKILWHFQEMVVKESLRQPCPKIPLDNVGKLCSEDGSFDSENIIKNLRGEIKCIDAEMLRLESEYQKELHDHHEVAPFNTYYAQLGEHMAQVGVDPTINKWDQPFVLGAVDPHDSLSHPAGVSDAQAESAASLDPDLFTNFVCYALTSTSSTSLLKLTVCYYAQLDYLFVEKFPILFLIDWSSHQANMALVFY